MDNNIEGILTMLYEADPLYKDIAEDVIIHMKLLNVCITPMSLKRVLTNVPNDVLELYKDNQMEAYYKLYEIVEKKCYIPSNKFIRLEGLE